MEEGSVDLAQLLLAGGIALISGLVSGLVTGVVIARYQAKVTAEVSSLLRDREREDGALRELIERLSDLRGHIDQSPAALGLGTLMSTDHPLVVLVQQLMDRWREHLGPAIDDDAVRREFEAIADVARRASGLAVHTHEVATLRQAAGATERAARDALRRRE
jgi:hypothetical protein